MKYHLSIFPLYLMLLLLLPSSSQAQQWTRFRGPNGTGISKDSNLPEKITKENFKWNVELPGTGHSSPVVWGNRLFILSADQKDATRYVLCLDVDSGKTLWEKKFQSSFHHLHSKNSFASCTPAVDQERVYVAWSTEEETTLMALTHDGKPVWEVDLGSWVSQHGFGTSPIVHEDRIYLSGMQLGEPGKLRGKDPGESFLIALNSETGKQIWRVPRESAVTSYAVPCIYQDQNGKSLLICNSTAHGMAAHDLSDGHEVWSVHAFDKRTVSSPVIINNYLFGSTGSGGGGNYVVAVDPSGSPQVKHRWAKSAPYVPTPVGKGKLAFLWYDKGVVSCVDTTNGKTIWQKRVGGNFSGSPIRVNDKLYSISEEGDLVVLAAAENFELLNRISLGDFSHSTPAVADGKMFLRTYSRLICVSK